MADPTLKDGIAAVERLQARLAPRFDHRRYGVGCALSVLWALRDGGDVEAAIAHAIEPHREAQEALESERGKDESR